MKAYRIAYDGTPYHGFQRQPDVKTVEGTILASLAALGVIPSPTTLPPGYAAAGRTDAGTAATAQTIAFEAPDWLGPEAFNSELPPSIRAWAAATVEDDFHATHAAVAREYTYFLHEREATRAGIELVLDTLAGEHDFHNLTPDERGTRRTLEPSYEYDRPTYVLQFRAGGFPRQLIRRIVSLITTISDEDNSQRLLEWILGDDPVDGPAGIGPAPADGLVLTNVEYDAISFEPAAPAVETTRELFEQLHRQRAVRTRVAAELASLDS